jgi:anti-sigma B factor antagonist
MDRIQHGNSRIIIDLEHVDFLDSAGIAVMISGLRLATNSDGTLVLVQPGDQVRRMLRLTNLDQVLQTFPSVEDAVSMGPPQGRTTT